jgi:glutamate/tyrosine decarboxylase-like PLP-dependent enzyme
MTRELLLPDAEERAELWSEVVAQAEAYFVDVESLPVAPTLDQAELVALLDTFSFDEPGPRIDVLRRFTLELKKHQVHTPHPCYFGLFNPAPAFMGILGDCIAATLNPQLAAWSHSPLAVETERRVVDAFGRKFGIPEADTDGCLTTGGAEANLTGLLCALTARWPDVLNDGLQSIAAKPAFYASAESHHSFVKAARTAGLGRAALRTVPVTDKLQMNIDALREMIEQDKAVGMVPFLVVGTAGTTGAGVVDQLKELGEVAQSNQLWFHVDAAWGGAAALVPELRAILSGLDKADSITFDPHKWLSIPMGAGIFLTRHRDALGKIFSVNTAYMPKEGERLTVVDPFVHSLQWSRRFIGLKLFMTLATTGWDGYAKVIRHQSEMGDYLRAHLKVNGWRIVNDSQLPVVCFTPANENWDMATHQRAADAVVQSGHAWISTILLGGKTPALRACITNYRTTEEHVETLLEVLSNVREQISLSSEAASAR